MTDTMTYTGTLRVVTCWCGIVHAVPYDLDDFATRTGKAVFCPLGHEWVRGENIAKKLREAEERTQRLRGLLEDEREQHHRTERRLTATRGVVTRTKRRIAKGLCPRCHEHFGNVEAHIASEHPDYAGEAAALVVAEPTGNKAQ